MKKGQTRRSKPRPRTSAELDRKRELVRVLRRERDTEAKIRSLARQLGALHESRRQAIGQVAQLLANEINCLVVPGDTLDKAQADLGAAQAENVELRHQLDDARAMRDALDRQMRALKPADGSRLALADEPVPA